VGHAPAAVARENALSVMELTVDRVGWGLAISGEPTVHLRGLADTPSAYSSPTRRVHLPRVFRCIESREAEVARPTTRHRRWLTGPADAGMEWAARRVSGSRRPSRRVTRD